jgi:predicted O-methyltransferase YrrM
MSTPDGSPPPDAPADPERPDAGAVGLIRRAVRSGMVRVQRRIADLNPDEQRRSRRDLDAALVRAPFLTTVRDGMPSIAARYADDHRDYCARVGHPVHAASLELVGVLLGLVDATAPRRVVDLGSGFTSFVLRDHARASGIEVHSVDDSAAWLDRTRGYLREKGVSDGNLHHWPDFQRLGMRGGFGLVLHDMGFMDVRLKTLEQVLDLAAPGGWVVLDDMHKAEYRAAALAVLERRRLEHWSLKALTRDRLTRYAYLVQAEG